jgi:hypothetical protein
MSWHIFRKDWKLLWRMVIGVAMANAISRLLISLASSYDNGPNPLMGMAGAFQFMSAWLPQR